VRFQRKYLRRNKVASRLTLKMPVLGFAVGMGGNALAIVMLSFHQHF
jgi:hypothetical protein